MINFDKQATGLEEQQQGEANTVKAQFEQIQKAIEANGPIIKAALNAAKVANDQLAPLLKAAAIAAASPASRPTPGGESYENEGEV